jgi:hypothetical protein
MVISLNDHRNRRRRSRVALEERGRVGREGGGGCQCGGVEVKMECQCPPTNAFAARGTYLCLLINATD